MGRYCRLVLEGEYQGSRPQTILVVSHEVFGACYVEGGNMDNYIGKLEVLFK